jgi:hypothetical protein
MPPKIHPNSFTDGKPEKPLKSRGTGAFHHDSLPTRLGEEPEFTLCEGRCHEERALVIERSAVIDYRLYHVEPHSQQMSFAIEHLGSGVEEEGVVEKQDRARLKGQAYRLG